MRSLVLRTATVIAFSTAVAIIHLGTALAVNRVPPDVLRTVKGGTCYWYNETLGCPDVTVIDCTGTCSMFGQQMICQSTVTHVYQPQDWWAECPCTVHEEEGQENCGETIHYCRATAPCQGAFCLFDSQTGWFCHPDGGSPTNLQQPHDHCEPNGAWEECPSS